MQRPAEYFRAESLPIVATVGEMQVPSLIDRIGRSHLAVARDRQKTETAILIEHAQRMRLAPAIFAREPLHERQASVLGGDDIG